jgi:hypothetical protein
MFSCAKHIFLPLNQGIFPALGYSNFKNLLIVFVFRFSFKHSDNFEAILEQHKSGRTENNRI